MFALFITAGYWITSSTSFANPTVTIARIFTDTFTGTHHIHQLPIHGVIPRIAIWNDDIPSDIGDDRIIWAAKSRWSLKGIYYRTLIKLQGFISK